MQTYLLGGQALLRPDAYSIPPDTLAGFGVELELGTGGVCKGGTGTRKGGG